MVLVDRQDYFVVDQNWGCSKSVENVEWSKRKLPAHFTGGVVRNQSKLLKECVNVDAVSNRTRRGRAIYVLQTALLLSRHLASPENLSRLTIETDHQQHVIIMRRDEDVIPCQHWRRVSC